MSKLSGRKRAPEEGERCARGHEPNWVQYKDGQWYCRECRAQNNRDYRKHVKMTNPKQQKKIEAARKRRYFERHPERWEAKKKRDREAVRKKRAAEKKAEQEQKDAS